MVPGDPLSPEWWVQRLYMQLMRRNANTKKFARYYEGDFDLPWLPAQAEAEFQRILLMTRSNYMGLVIDAMVERMNLIGFRRKSTTDGSADKDIWRVWQYNNMDSFYDQGLLEAAIHGSFYMLVAPNPKNAKNPLVYVEHPTQAIVEHKPGTNRRERAAGLKCWIDDWTGYVFATLYLPDMIYKFQAKDPSATITGLGLLPDERQLSALTRQWERRIVPGENWPVRNAVGEVPLVESPNNPRLLHGGISEIADLITIQDRISKTIADRMMTQDYGAFPQRWASAWPKEDQSGTSNQPVDIGRTRILTTDIAETRFGQFDSAPLDPYSAAKREDVTDIASRSRTPAHYLIAGLSNVNGATLKASESGLVSKVAQRMSGHSDPAQDTARIIGDLAGITIADDDFIEVMWANPEFRTQAETTDALIKMRQAVEMPVLVAWEKWGATPTEIERWQKLREKEQEEAAKTDPAMMLAEQYRQANGPGAPSATQKDNGNAPVGGGRSAADPQKVTKPNGLTK
jgi:hypothetical protein